MQNFDNLSKNKNNLQSIMQNTYQQNTINSVKNTLGSNCGRLNTSINKQNQTDKYGGYGNNTSLLGASSTTHSSGTNSFYSTGYGNR